MHMFVESFQGQYKDGTNSTRDFRMVSASFLILRILILALLLNHTCSSSHLFIFTYIRTSCFPFCMCFLCSCYHQAIQVKLHE